MKKISYPYLITGSLVLAGIVFWQTRPQAQAQQPVAAKAVMAVELVRPQAATWPMRLAANGNIAAWQEAIVAAETGGLRIAALHADIGDKVKRGQLLAELARDSVLADMRRYEAAVASARASLAQARSDAERARQIKGSGALSEQKINDYQITEQTAQASLAQAQAQLDAEKVTLSQTSIVAVDDGIITSKSAVLGNVVSSGAELFRLQRQGRLEWQAEVDAKQLASIQPGSAAEVSLPDGKVLQGKIRLSAPSLSTSTGRAYVYVSLPAGARAGMFASGYLHAGEQQVLTLPQSSMVYHDGISYVYELGGGSKVIRRRVSVLSNRQQRVAVSGIRADARIVKAGAAYLADGDLVTVSGGGQ